MRNEAEITHERVIIGAICDHAESAEALIPCIEAVLEEANEKIRACFRGTGFDEGIAHYMDHHGSRVQDILGAALYLLKEVKETQSSIVELAIGCFCEQERRTKRPALANLEKSEDVFGFGQEESR